MDVWVIWIINQQNLTHDIQNFFEKWVYKKWNRVLIIAYIYLVHAKKKKKEKNRWEIIQ